MGGVGGTWRLCHGGEAEGASGAQMQRSARGQGLRLAASREVVQQARAVHGRPGGVLRAPRPQCVHHSRSLAARLLHLPQADTHTCRRPHW